MYVLDTNVLAELAKSRPDRLVSSWLSHADEGQLYLVAVVVGELARGIYRLPGGKKRRALERWLEESLLPRFEGRILAFDHEAAVIWGRLMGERERAGRTPPDRDCQIAAVALRHGLTVVTRNTRDFENLGVSTIDPWEA